MIGSKSRLLYFAFGSNLDREQMTRRCPGSTAQFVARLDGHRIAFTHLSTRWGGGAADVIPAAETEVWGVVYALDSSHLERLDGYEAGYRRTALRVRGLDGGAHQVTSYSAKQKGEYLPSRIYLDKMLHWGSHWDFPVEYLRQLRAFDVCD